MDKYKKICLLMTILIISVFAFMPETTRVIAAPYSEDAPTNHLFVDVTYDPKAKTYTLGGFTEAQLKEMGFPELPGEVWMALGSLEQLSLKIDGSALAVNAGDAKLATINWDKNSRAWIYGLIDNFSQMPPMDQKRAEEWLEKADLQLVIRKSSELSKPLVLDMATLVNVDISKDGAVKVEGFNTGSIIPAEAAAILTTGEIKDLTICWNKGVLSNKVNGNVIPQIVLYKEGVAVVDKAFGLNLGDLSQLFQSQVGASVIYGEGLHMDSKCGD
ncbi:MAG: hypothetical protein VB108_02115 [Anaerolineaceae bacterium]|nr:hypothetical protein [Anaerolineaceae bacterium]